MQPRFETIRTLVFLTASAVGMLYILNHASGLGLQIYQVASWHSVLDGKLTQVVDREVVAAIPGSPVLDGWVAGLIYKSLGDAGPQVTAGCPGWLFLSEELRETPKGEQYFAERIRLVTRFAEAFAAKSITLVILAVPDKSELAYAGRCGIALAQQAKERSARWHKAIVGLRLPVIEIVSSWPRPGYWRTDTHWDRRGARFAAERTAQMVHPWLRAGEQRVYLESAANAHNRYGDLMLLADLIRTSALLGPLPDQEVYEAAVVERSGGLLDDTPLPAAILAGSSYSLTSGFYDYLQFSLQREVAQMSLPGSGFSGALLEIVEKRAAALETIGLVIWEMPMRSLTQPLTDAERRFLQTN